MKRYIHIALVALVAQCGLSNVVYAMKITPTNIKQYSDLTEADEKQWKLLKLGQLGTVGAFLAGAASTIGTGVGIYQKVGMAQTPKAVVGFGAGISQKPGMVQNIITEYVPSWLTNPIVLASLGSLGAGYMSYTTLYPRMRAGVLNKVQRFIDVCEAVMKDSPDRQYTVVNFKFSNLHELQQSYLPSLWVSENDVAVWDALSNLEEQGKTARTLLVQIGLSDPEIERKYNDIGRYIAALSWNRQLYEWSPVVQQKKNEPQYKLEQERKERQEKLQEQRDIAQLADLEAGTNAKQAGARLMNVQAAKTYLDMITDTAKKTWDTLNYIYKNKEKIVYRGTILSGAAYVVYILLQKPN
jgi:hypothetical protein